MADNKPNEESVTMEKAIVKRKKGISPIWILPLVAALIGVWLIYKGIVEAPIKVVIKIHTESLKSILAGGIQIPTPDNGDMGKRAKQNTTFKLYPQVKAEWLKWMPKIRLGSAS